MVSIKFGKACKDGPSILSLVTVDRHAKTVTSTIDFNLENHVAEVLAGVARANADSGKALQVEAIEVVPGDRPGKGHAEHVAYQIALAVADGEWRA